MQTVLIPVNQWTEFFNQLNHDQAGWMTTIQVLDSELGPQNVAGELPFRGISFDTKGSRPNRLQISAGKEPQQHVHHVVDLPLHIRQTQESDGSVDIQIEPANGSVTLMHLHNQM